jgi:hypothetical protein
MHRNILIAGLVILAALGTQIFKIDAMSIQSIAAKPMAEKAMMNQPVAKMLAKGNFVKAEHNTLGEATIVIENGTRYLELSDRFQTDHGPDLFVLLHQQDQPKDYRDKDYVNLGRLQMLKGKQRYEIPDAVTLEDMRSIVVWCRRFNATFGYAALVR